MDVLGSPLEALAFNYVGFVFLTTVKSFWTWVAVLTAAISFWRIRAVGSHSRSHKSDAPPSFHDQRTDGSQAPEVLTRSNSENEPARACSCISSVSAVEDDGRVKGKFSVFYEGVGYGDGDGNDESTLTRGWSDGDVDTVNVDEVYSVKEVYAFESWEEMLVRRTGDLGWYCYQDLTVLDGSVVKLWEGIRRRNSPSFGVRW